MRWLVVGLMLMPVTVNALTLEVITDQPDHIRSVTQLKQQGITVTIHDLTAAERMEQQLAQGLTGTSEQVRAQLNRRFEKLGRKTVEAQLKQAFQAVIQAVQYQVDRHPAIIINQGEAVIYGVTDLGDALRRYRQWRTTH